jgi:hypothetical protein
MAEPATLWGLKRGGLSTEVIPCWWVTTARITRHIPPYFFTYDASSCARSLSRTDAHGSGTKAPLSPERRAAIEVSSWRDLGVFEPHAFIKTCDSARVLPAPPLQELMNDYGLIMAALAAQDSAIAEQETLVSHASARRGVLPITGRLLRAQVCSRSAALAGVISYSLPPHPTLIQLETMHQHRDRLVEQAAGLRARFELLNAAPTSADRARPPVPAALLPRSAPSQQNPPPPPPAVDHANADGLLSAMTDLAEVFRLEVASRPLSPSTLGGQQGRATPASLRSRPASPLQAPSLQQPPAGRQRPTVAASVASSSRPSTPRSSSAHSRNTDSDGDNFVGGTGGVLVSPRLRFSTATPPPAARTRTPPKAAAVTAAQPQGGVPVMVMGPLGPIEMLMTAQVREVFIGENALPLCWPVLFHCVHALGLYDSHEPFGRFHALVVTCLYRAHSSPPLHRLGPELPSSRRQVCCLRRSPGPSSPPRTAPSHRCHQRRLPEAPLRTTHHSQCRLAWRPQGVGP